MEEIPTGGHPYVQVHLEIQWDGFMAGWTAVAVPVGGASAHVWVLPLGEGHMCLLDHLRRRPAQDVVRPTRLVVGPWGISGVKVRSWKATVTCCKGAGPT